MVPARNDVAAQPATTANIAHSTGRHRRDGSRPSGNSKTTKNSSAAVSAVNVSENHPASRAPGTDPGAVASPYSAYCSVSMLAASDSPMRPSSQPMALRGTRFAITPPAPAYMTTATAAMP